MDLAGRTQLRLRFAKTTNGDSQLDMVDLASALAGATGPVLTVTYR